MTIASITAGSTLRPPLSGFGVLHRVKAAYRQRGMFRQTVNELSALNDRDLRDIGIARAEIRRIARKEALRA